MSTPASATVTWASSAGCPATSSCGTTAASGERQRRAPCLVPVPGDTLHAARWLLLVLSPASVPSVCQDGAVTCEELPCPIPCGWSAWSPWTPCDRSCGVGTQERFRCGAGEGGPDPRCLVGSGTNTAPCPQVPFQPCLSPRRSPLRRGRPGGARVPHALRPRYVHPPVPAMWGLLRGPPAPRGQEGSRPLCSHRPRWGCPRGVLRCHACVCPRRAQQRLERLDPLVPLLPELLPPRGPPRAAAAIPALRGAGGHLPGAGGAGGALRHGPLPG